MGFDPWSFLFQAINFVVLVLVLTRVVYRPLRKSIHERNARIEEREEAAAARQAEADAKVKEAAANARRINEERDAVLREMREQAAVERARLVSQAEEDAAAARERAKHLIEMDREAALEHVRELAVDKSTQLASALVAGLSHEAIDEALLSMLIDEVRTHLGATAAAARAGTAAAGLHAGSAAVEVTFAHAPRPAAVERLKSAIAESLGEPIDVTSREDAALVAGVVVRMRHAVWDASIAGQLSAFRERARRELEREASRA